MTERYAYTITSLKLHAFHLQAMKEHTVFLAAGSIPEDSDYIKQVLDFKEEAESLLCHTAKLNDTSQTITLEHSQQVYYLNQQVLMTLDTFLRFQEALPDREFFHPAFSEHLLAETDHYRKELLSLDKRNCRECVGEKPDKRYFDRLRREHAFFLCELSHTAPPSFPLKLLKAHMAMEETYYSGLTRH